MDVKVINFGRRTAELQHEEIDRSQTYRIAVYWPAVVAHMRYVWPDQRCILLDHLQVMRYYRTVVGVQEMPYALANFGGDNCVPSRGKSWPDIVQANESVGDAFVV